MEGLPICIYPDVPEGVTPPKKCLQFTHLRWKSAPPPTNTEVSSSLGSLEELKSIFKDRKQEGLSTRGYYDARRNVIVFKVAMATFELISECFHDIPNIGKIFEEVDW